MKKRFLVLLLAIIASAETLPAYVRNVEVGGFNYRISDSNTATVLYYSGAKTNEYVIPSTIDYTYTHYDDILNKNVTITDTYPVVGISSGAFDDETKVTSIIVPNSVTVIGDHAFSNVPNVIYSGSAAGAPWGARCINGTTEGWLVFSDEDKTQLVACNASASGEITIPNSVVTIRQNAFYECTQITSFIIGTGLETVEINAFEYCWNVTSVTIHSNALMNAGHSMADIFEGSNITEFILGEEITSIGPGSFAGCDRIVSMEIPESVKNIGNRAFAECYNLTSINIPDNVIIIGDGAFYSCSKLNSIEIPNNVISLGKEAFYECDSLKYAIIGDGVTEIGERTFSYCYNLDSVVVGNGVTKIGYEAFESCRNLSSLTFGYSLDTIKSNAFDECRKLESLEFPSSLKFIGDDAFGDCILNSATFHNGVSLTNETTFGFIDTLNVYMTDSTRSYQSLVGYLTDNYRHRNAPNINIMPGSTCIERDVFMREYASWPNKSLERITIPASIAYIPDSCFMNCVNLREVEIGLLEAEGEENGENTVNVSRRVKAEEIFIDDKIVTKAIVGERALKDCTSLFSIKFGSNVKEIKDGACENLTNLSKITFIESGEDLTIEEEVFAGCGLKELTLPANIIHIGHLAFANNPLTSVDMKCSTKSCKEGKSNKGYYAQFENCPYIEKIALLMEQDGPSLYDICGSNNCYRNLKELLFYEGSTIAAVGSSNGENSAMPNLTTLQLASTITIIGAYSFNHTTNLEKVTFPSSLTEIGNHAFEGSGLKLITTYAPKPTAGTDAFAGRINKTSLKCEKPAIKTWYETEDIWKDFFTFNNSDNTPTSLSSYEVQVNTESHVATVSYPVTYGSAFSELTVTSQESGEASSFEFHFDSAFAMPKRHSCDHKSVENTNDTINGYSFTIQRLTPNTTYDYSISLYDAEENLLEEFTGTFTTQADETTVLDQIGQEAVTNSKKLLRNGQLFILRGDKRYTITGQKVE